MKALLARDQQRRPPKVSEEKEWKSTIY
jgi:hypothetical protein